MSAPKKIDADITTALNRWVGAIGTPDHQAASEALDTLLVGLTRARRDSDLLEWFCDTAEHGIVIRRWFGGDSWPDKIEALPVIEIRAFEDRHFHDHEETIWDALRRECRDTSTSTPVAALPDQREANK